MGDSITEGSVLEFKKNAGQHVDLDEIVAIIETDKVQVEIRSPFAGTITKLYANQGDTVNVGKPIFDVDTEGKASTAAEAKSEPTKADAPKAEAQKAELK
jgi:2-oxoglutarate dehydrogenase E2 component (dihydrolipoamide succinyltransferase)